MSGKAKAMVAILTLTKDNVNFQSASFDSLYLIRAKRTPSTPRFLMALSEKIPALLGLDIDHKHGRHLANGLEVLLAFREISHEAASILMNEQLVPFIDFIEEEKEHAL